MDPGLRPPPPHTHTHTHTHTVALTGGQPAAGSSLSTTLSAPLGPAGSGRVVESGKELARHRYCVSTLPSGHNSESP